MPDQWLATVVRHIRRLTAPADAAEGTDRQLLHAFTAGNDQEAFAALVRRHGPLVLRVCRGVLGHEQDAEDAFQATFLVLARKAATARWDHSVGHWLYEVAHRVASGMRVQDARRQRWPTASPPG